MNKLGQFPEMTKIQSSSSKLTLELKEKLSSLEKKNQSLLLQTFGHQVSGRATMLCYDSNTICKSYVSRELFFYHFLPPVLKAFTPQFRGIINVTFIENRRTGSVLPYVQPQTLLQARARDIYHWVEKPKPHSKRCVKDFGKTHVIYPSNPSLTTLPDNAIASAKDIDSLTHEFDTNVTLNKESVTSSNLDDPPGECSGLHNPWSSKIIDDTWTKLKSNYIEGAKEPRKMSIAKTKRFMLLENVTSPYRRPCVLDLKMGTRVRQNASAAKLARHVTAIDLGARLSGMQIYQPQRNEFDYINKYCGHNLSVNGFKAKLVQFFSRGHTTTSSHHKNSDFYVAKPNVTEEGETLYWKTDVDLVKCAIAKLARLRDAVASLEAHRFYSCSVLLIYEGETAGNLSLSSVQTRRDRSSDNESSGNQLFAKEDISPEYSVASDPMQPRPSSLQTRRSGSVNKSADSSPETSQKTSLLFGGGDGSLLRDGIDTMKKLNEKTDTSQTNVIKSDGDHFSSQSKSSSKRCGRTKSYSVMRKLEAGKTSQTAPDLSRQNFAEVQNSIDVRLIDFAHFCFQDSVVHPGPDGGFLFGLDNVISLLNVMLEV